MKDIEGFEGKYAVTEEGKIYSYKNRIFLIPSKDGSGHHQVSLGRGNKRKVHRLVAEAFIPNPNNLPLVLHGILGKSDNSVNNLRWGTHSENLKDAWEFGERSRDVGKGASHGNSKLTDEQVKEIFTLSHTSKLTQAEIGAKFSVTYAQVSHIKRKVQWSHVTDTVTRD